jgi:hypothetical protein
MRSFALLPLLALAACATSFRSPPAEVIRYSLPSGIERGTAVVEPARPGLMTRPYEAAVAREMVRNGYPAATTGASQYVAVVDIRQRGVESPARRSPFQIGIGGGGFSGGRGGGVGLGGGVGFPVGGGRGAVWEGHARGLNDPRATDGSDAAVADRLAAALFTGFPGESGRTITVP